jgi:hypothetical protein
VIVSRDARARETLSREVSGRYGVDYRVLVCDEPAEVEPVIGVFAAGDVRRGAVKRVASAVGEGAITIPLVHRYLEASAVPVAAGR